MLFVPVLHWAGQGINQQGAEYVPSPAGCGATALSVAHSVSPATEKSPASSPGVRHTVAKPHAGKGGRGQIMMRLTASSNFRVCVNRDQNRRETTRRNERRGCGSSVTRADYVDTDHDSAYFAALSFVSPR